MIVAWRLVKARHAADALTGEGARLYGGRWNERGTPLVYLGGSVSLCVLESLVHLGLTDRGIELRLIRIEIPDETGIERLDRGALPADWRTEPAPASTRTMGSAWAREGRSAVLEVPSVLVPQESNYLLNPLHPGAQALRVDPPLPFSLDSRLWKA